MADRATEQLLREVVGVAHDSQAVIKTNNELLNEVDRHLEELVVEKKRANDLEEARQKAVVAFDERRWSRLSTVARAVTESRYTAPAVLIFGYAAARWLGIEEYVHGILAAATGSLPLP